MTCGLLAQTDGGYELRLSHDGAPFMQIRCASPHDALTHSLNAMGTLFTHGWHTPAPQEPPRRAEEDALSSSCRTRSADTVRTRAASKMSNSAGSSWIEQFPTIFLMCRLWDRNLRAARK
jgi:hypothetical protein